MRIEVWSDVVCPWCYIGKRRLETALESFPHRDEVEVEYRSFQLDPTAPVVATQSSNDVLAARFGDADRVREMQEHVAGLAADEGLHFHLEGTPHVNTRTAHRLLHLARSADRATEAALNEALLSAYFEHGENVGDVDVLRRIATAHGLDPARVDEVLASDEFDDEVATDIAQAQAYGATGVPFFVIDRAYGISGAQPAELFAEALQTAYDAARA